MFKVELCVCMHTYMCTHATCVVPVVKKEFRHVELGI